MSTLPTGRRAAAQPLGIEFAHVTLSQRAVLAIACPLRLGQLRREQQQRTKHQAQQKDHNNGDLNLELR